MSNELSSHEVSSAANAQPQIVAQTDIGADAPVFTIDALNAYDVPESLRPDVDAFHKEARQSGVSVDTRVVSANVPTLRVNVLNREDAIPYAADSKTAESPDSTSFLSEQSPAVDAHTFLQTTWYFSGENELATLSIQVGKSVRQEDFVRMRLPAQTLLLAEKKLKPTAHQQHYDQLSGYLTQVKRGVAGNRVILSGGPGLGKSYCAQHYLYHTAPGRHQMVAWLSGKSQDTFEQDWHRLAEQFRQIDSDLSQVDDTTAIRTWCEQKLGQWLFVIDDVNLAPDYLEQRLPRQGGHVLLTTRYPHYALSDAAQIPFSPLNVEDSRRLVEAYFGRYWSNTGHAAEEAQVSQLLTVMAGYPVALAQAALLIHKKGLSFTRFMAQFQDATTRPHLLQDTVFGALRTQQTAAHCWADSQQQLQATLQSEFPEVAPEAIEKHLSDFMAALVQSGEAVDFSTQETHRVKTDDLMRDGFGSLALPAAQQERLLAAYQTYLPKYFPIYFDPANNTWHFTSMSLTILQRAIGRELAPSIFLPALEEKTAAVAVAEEEKEVNNSKTVDPLSVPPPEASIRPIAVKFSFDGAHMGDIEMVVQTENYQQRQAKLKQGWKLPRPNPNFIPREKLTLELAEKLPVEAKETEKTQKVLLTTAVTGMGGVGKTELARHFITQHPQSQEYSYRFWLDASTPVRLYSEYRELALYLHLIEQKPYVEDEEVLKRLKKWLSINQGWLLVLDNADQYTSIEALIPEVGGCVVVTTRDKRPGTLPQDRVVEVPVLAPEEAFNWLCQLAHRPVETLAETEKAAAEQLLGKLGYLPLAIAQAAAFLRANPDVTITAYLEQFATLLSDKTLAKGEAIEEIEGDAYARLVVSSTWNISRQAIRKHIAHPKLADGLLGACAYLAAKDIPLSVLELEFKQRLLGACAYLAAKDVPLSALELWFKQTCQDQVKDTISLNYWLDEYVGQLVRYSLVDRDAQTGTLSLHNLLQEVMRLEDMALMPEKIFTAHLWPLAAMLQNLYRYEKKIEDYKKAALLHPHLVAISTHLTPYLNNLSAGDWDNESSVYKCQWYLLGAIGNFHLTVSGKAEEGFRYTENALVTILQACGDAHPEVAASYNNLGLAYLNVGNVQEALAYHQKALDIQLKVYGEAHSSVATSYNNLGSVYQTLGDMREALTYYQKALDIQLKVYEEAHPSVAISYANLGTVYEALGNVQEAVTCQQKALGIFLKIYGEGHPHVATSYTNLGRAYEALGNAQEALTCQKKALGIKLKVYGEAHPDVAMSYGNLGNVYLALGNVQEALTCHQKALETFLKVYGESHPHVATSYNNLGETYYSLGNVQEALTCQKKALDTRLEIYGEAHPAVAISYNNLGDVYRSLGNAQEALTCQQKALGIRLKVYEETHPVIASSYVNLGNTYQALGDIKEALTYQQKALDILLTVYGDAHPHVAASYGNLGNTYQALGNAQEALTCHKKALGIYLKAYGEAHPKVATSYNNLGEAYRSLGNAQEALVCQKKALAIFFKAYGDAHPDVAISYTNLGASYYRLGNAQEALACQQKALAIRLKVYGEAHPDVATSYINLVGAYRSLGNAQEAFTCQQKALDVRLKVYGEAHPDVAISYNNLGDVYRSLGNAQEALACRQKALAVRLKVYGEAHPDVATSYSNLGNAYRSLGNTQEALTYYQKALDVRLKVYGEAHPDVAISYNYLGDFYNSFWDVEKALVYFEKALAVRLQVYGEAHPDVATNYANLGNAYNHLGDEQKALTYYEKGLTISLQIYGEAHLEVATSYSNLGNAYRSLSNAQEALDCQQKALGIFIKVYGADHPSVADKHNDLGFLLKEQNKLEKALGHFEAALASNINTYGEDHSRTVTSHNNLALLLQDIGQLPEARVHFEAALKSALRIYGENHPEVAIFRYNLGSLLQAQGQLLEARPHLEAALVSDLRTYGEDHPNVARIRRNIGRLLSELGQTSSAKILVEQAFAVQKKRFGLRHKGTVLTLIALGRVYHQLGNTEKAQETLQEALDITDELYAENDPERARARMPLGAVLTTLGRFDRALQLHEEGIAIKRVRYGESHVLLVSALREKGITLREMGNHNAAEAVFIEAIAMAEKHFDPHHFEVGLLQGELGSVYKATGQIGRAATALSQAVAVLTSHQRPEAAHCQAILDSLDLSVVSNTTASSQEKLAQMEEAGEQRQSEGEMNFETEQEAISHTAQADQQKVETEADSAVKEMVIKTNIEPAITLCEYMKGGDYAATEAMLSEATTTFETHTNSLSAGVALFLDSLNRNWQPWIASSSQEGLAQNGATPLYLAVQEGNLEVVQTLLAEGADINAANWHGTTHLSLASYHGHGEIVRTLLAANAVVNTAEADGDTPLHNASRQGHSDVVKDLLENGAATNVVNKDGATPLYTAAEAGHVAVVNALIDAGADITIAQKDVTTPLAIATKKGHGAIVDLLKKKANSLRMALADTPLQPDHTAQADQKKVKAEESSTVMEMIKADIRLGITLCEIGDYAVAEAILLEAMTKLKMHADSQHVEISQYVEMGLLQGALGSLYQTTGQIDRAATALCQAVTVLTSHQRPESAHYQAILDSVNLRILSNITSSLQEELAQMEMIKADIRLGITACEMGDYAAAEATLLGAMTRLKTHADSQHVEISQYVEMGLLQGALGSVYQRTGQIDRAATALSQAVRALTIYQRPEAAYYREILDSVFKMQIIKNDIKRGIMLCAFRDYTAAEATLLEAMTKLKTHADSQHVEISQYVEMGLLQGALGSLYQATGQIDSAATALSQAVTVLTSHQRPEVAHYQTILDSLDLSVVREIERELDIFRGQYGGDHHKIAIALAGLGNTYGAQGDIIWQRDFLERALSILETHCGQDPYQIAIVLGNLGNTYADLGNVVKQRDLLERALAIFEAHCDQDHYHQVAIALMNLGNAYGEFGDAVKKRDMSVRALTILEERYGHDHPLVATALLNLGNAYGALGDIVKQQELLMRALSIKEAHFGQDHYEVAITLRSLGIAYGALGDTDKRRALLERALAIQEAHYGPNHFEVAITLVGLGNAYGALGDIAKKRDILERALAIKAAHYGQNHYQVATTLANLGVAHGDLGDITKKQIFLEHALAIKEAHYGQDHYQVASTLANLGIAYGDLGDAAKKQDCLERAVAIKEAHYGQDNPELVITLTNLAVAYQELQQSNAALQTAQRAYHILMQHPLYGENHPKTKQCVYYLRSACGFTTEDLQMSVARYSYAPAAQQPGAAAVTSVEVAALNAYQGTVLNQGRARVLADREEVRVDNTAESHQLAGAF